MSNNFKTVKDLYAVNIVTISAFVKSKFLLFVFLFVELSEATQRPSPITSRSEVVLLRM